MQERRRPREAVFYSKAGKVRGASRHEATAQVPDSISCTKAPWQRLTESRSTGVPAALAVTSASGDVVVLAVLVRLMLVDTFRHPHNALSVRPKSSGRQP